MQLSGLERPNNDRFQYLSDTPVKRPENRLHGIVLRLDLTLECLGRNNLVSRHLNGLCIDPHADDVGALAPLNVGTSCAKDCLYSA